MFKKIGIGLGALVAIFVVVGFFLPAEFSVSRSKTIKAAPETVFAQVNDLKKTQAWSPWAAADDTLKVTYGATIAGKGASYSWTSENMGAGTFTITESVPHTKIVNDWEKADGGGIGQWDFEPVDGGTKATWTMSGDSGMNIMKRYFGLMMDSMMGGYFEDGLDRLAKISEAMPPPTPPAAAAPKADDAKETGDEG